MSTLTKDLQSIVTAIKTLTKQTEKITTRIEKLDKSLSAKKVPKRVPAKATKKRVSPKKTTASDTILSLILKSKKGIDTASLKKRTGFKDNNIRTVIYRLKKRGKIKSERKGFYVKA